ncbi:hypothetical protein QW131_29165 [Roseibium salinum]|nr:hypothetical protein [Roseibium salinum]
MIRLGIGLSQSAYSEACGRLGRQAAAAILAVVAEKGAAGSRKDQLAGWVLPRLLRPCR